MIRRLVIATAFAVSLSGFILVYESATLVVAHMEAQRSVDAAVLAGAQSLMVNPYDISAAQQSAIQFASLNHVWGVEPALAAERVLVDTEEGIVQARLHVQIRPRTTFGRTVWLITSGGPPAVVVVAAAEARPFADGGRAPKRLKLIR